MTPIRSRRRHRNAEAPADRHPRQRAGARPGEAVADALRRAGRRGRARSRSRPAATGPGAPGDKSRFVKEIEDALLAGEVDLAVHSAKDVPGRLPDGLAIAAVPAGEDPRDALVGATEPIDALPDGARVGTRACAGARSCWRARPTSTSCRCAATSTRGCESWPRANATRSCWRSPACGGSAARTRPAPRSTWTDSCRRRAGAAGARDPRGRRAAATAVAPLEDAGARARLEAERAVVAALDASCHTPVGAHAHVEGERIEVHAYAGCPTAASGSPTGWRPRAAEPARRPGRELARRMLAAGAGELLRRAESTLGA